MRFVTVRDLRNHPTEVWSAIDHDDVVITSNGRPLGVLVRVEGDDLEGTLANIRRARGLSALSRIRTTAAENGTSTLTDAEIEAEVGAARRARRR